MEIEIITKGNKQTKKKQAAMATLTGRNLNRSWWISGIMDIYGDVKASSGRLPVPTIRQLTHDWRSSNSDQIAAEHIADASLLMKLMRFCSVPL